MRERIHRIVRHPLISGSAIILIGSLVGNFFNYIFNLSMGRLLSVSEYGILASLISIISIFSVFSSTITTVFTKFSASYIGQNKKELIGPLLRRGSVYVGVIGLGVLALLVILGTQVSSFLHIENVILIYYIALVLFVLFLSSVFYGALQGLLKFMSYSINYILYSIIKVIIGIGLVLLGFKILGAVLGLAIATLLGYFMLFIPLREFFINKDEKILPKLNLKSELSKYALPVFLSGLGMTMITSVDIILVKHFFSDVAAGQYAALSLMGRAIFFTISPITFVFFPLIAQKKEKKENLSGTILLASALIGIPLVLASFIYFLLPHLVLRVFFPAQVYTSLSSSLGPFSVFIILYTFSYFLNSYYLSIGKIKVFILTIIATASEILFIVFFHRDIAQIINGLIVISFLLLISLLLYYPRKKFNL